MKIIGIDDAGRGPVLGPMILAGVMIDSEEYNKILLELGVKDSKMLSSSKRAFIAEKIKRDYKYHIEVTIPGEIDESNNLNNLEAIKAAKIINKLTQDIDEKVRVIVDCPSVNIEDWSLFLEKLIIKEVELICEHKADFNHPVVSAASIIAKEKREEEMFAIRKEFKQDLGSGYPADPKTKEFIKENFDKEEFNSIIRFSWNTVKKLVKEKDEKQKKLF